ncbi:RNA polymerase sigma factor SigJ [Variovorax sp. CY25R-8]|nr:RNA polymerase subunit sigma-24 [Variovorax sp.]MCT8177883.1 RNA polymerase sigma factor SigJ [Variovorax sp. CY25R-8]
MSDVFEQVRHRLYSIGYRMLASAHEAEDLVQDAWLRWHEFRRESQNKVLNAEAWLVKMTTRMAIDRLRAAKLRRETYPGYWLPEPLLEDDHTNPEEIYSLADDVSVAFLILLDHLSPEARAAFLLREVFDVDYDQVAQILGKTEAAARQIVHRARRELEKARAKDPRPPALPVRNEHQHQVLRDFAHAISRGDFAGLQALLGEHAKLFSDGGGLVPSFGTPLLGARRIALMYFASHRRYGGAMQVQLVKLNGRWGLLRYIDGQLESAQSFEIGDQQIQKIHVQRNPEKLARLAATLVRLPAVV